ncbi:bacteriocin immunity protein [Companilactobacillus alimentarius]|uniref:Bacteriocin immunity protein n=1 Tax=Companilactobacillus alimentarius DSM 20249 TaxID=1423720 RepID=A0A2K9HHH6_9LACO|nr:bacteriocin immunity protein [Companilactobacillus alimentarius]AUI71979.1 bacteriocin immunity protein [Companilactobacillus alimentarius DSM 20249]MDT6952507.1 bacteriocin immunity protein [Companilactobacillus alimentarius]GEO44743.1 XRE family transcriptional regulator [Companilactobacillus alimentarius]
MSKLTWFAGGKDRGNEAISIIDDLLNNLNSQLLQEVLIEFKDELEKRESAVPYILSRMNVSISNALHKNKVSLTEEQQSKLQQLTQLSNIRYGY